MCVLTKLFNAVLQPQEHKSDDEYGNQGDSGSTVEFAEQKHGSA